MLLDGAAPFPEQRGQNEQSAEPMLRKTEWHRFGHSGVYRDAPFAFIFLLQLVATLVIAIANGAHVLWSEGDTAGAAASGAAASGAREHARDAAVRSHQMVMMLSVAAGVAAALAACWLALLRSGARALVWIGAGGSCALGFVNGLWLLMQGGVAGVLLGLLSLLICGGCVLFLLFNRQRVDFSIHLLSTVAELVRAFPATIYVAVGALAVQLGWIFVWTAAVSYTSQLKGEMTVMVLLALAFVWTSQCIKAVVHATVAGTVGSWSQRLMSQFVSRLRARWAYTRKQRLESALRGGVCARYFLSPNVPRNPTSRALRRAVTTSFGSLCLGSLVAAALQVVRGAARTASKRSSGGLRSACLCVLGFVDVLVRFFNEFAYTQVALYGKNLTRASRDTWTLLVHHSGVDALVQRDLIATALSLGAMLGGLASALLVGLWARALFGGAGGLWWEAHAAAFAIGYGSISLVSCVVESGVCALYVCYAEDPTPLAAINPQLYSLFISQPHVAPPRRGREASYGSVPMRPAEPSAGKGDAEMGL